LRLEKLVVPLIER